MSASWEASQAPAKPGDYFDRQRRVPGWDQDKIESQVALCLGTGGLGCTVAFSLARLGYKKIILIDKDVVDDHNLNRQLLFSKADVGKPKVEAAARNIQHHNLRSEIEPHHIDAVKNWGKIVELAKQSTVIFNMIDVGEYWDAAVQSLALALNIPFVLGGTFGNTLTVDFIAPGGRPCWCCLTGLPNKEITDRLAPANILSLPDIEFIPRDRNPIGQSNVYVCTTCCEMMVAQHVMHVTGNKVPSRLIFYFNGFDIEKWAVEANPECPMCAAAPSVTAEATK